MSLPAADDLFRPTTKPGRATSSGRKSGGSTPAARKATKSAKPVKAPASTAAASAAAKVTKTAKATKAVRAGSAPGRVPAAPDPARTPSGRVRHDEKMTVYVTAAELLELEHARLALRGSHGLAVDRGRLVREALALVLADFEEHGADSVLVRRLSAQ